MIDILVPTCRRPHRLADVAANIAAATVVEHQVTFIVEADDADTIAAARAISDVWVLINERARNYAGAINTAYLHSDADTFFTAADDLNFHPGWDTAALATLALPRIEVVGTNDLLNPYVEAGTHATHYLVDRRYLDRDGGEVDAGPGSFLHEGYDHQFTDTEFVGTAKARCRFAPCLDAVVEHCHYLAGKAEVDAGYEHAYAHVDEDEAIYLARRHLWWDLSR